MGREIRRVPLDFVFPIGESYAEAWYAQHSAERGADHECGDNCPYFGDTIPKGDGWQLWQTVSDGPISPVFKTPEELIEFMSQPVPEQERTPYAPEAYPPNPWAQGWARATAERFVRSMGSLPSGMIVNGRWQSAAEMVNELTAPADRIERGE